jgi:hypothetical protein
VIKEILVGSKEMTENTNQVQELMMIDNNLKLEGLCLDSMIDRFSNEQLYTLHCSINIKLLLEDTIFQDYETKFIFCSDITGVTGDNKLVLWLTYGDKQTIVLGSYNYINNNSYNLYVDVTIKSKPMAKFYKDDSCFVNDIILNSLFVDKTNLKLTSVVE